MTGSFAPPPPAPAIPPAGDPPRRPHRGTTTDIAVGFVLIAVGIMFFAAQAIPDAERLILLAIGLVLLALFVAFREYGLLIPAGIVTGLGLGLFLSETYGGDEQGGVIVFFLGLGFIAIWVGSLLLRMAEHHWWPLIPGGILATVGAGLLASERDVPLGGAIATAWPIGLVVAGILLVAQVGSGRRRTP
jgi:hypothetical protein